MKSSVNKILKKAKYQEKSNPGRHKKYEAPIRPRSTTFTSKKRKKLEEAIYEDMFD